MQYETLSILYIFFPYNITLVAFLFVVSVNKVHVLCEGIAGNVGLLKFRHSIIIVYITPTTPKHTPANTSHQ